MIKGQFSGIYNKESEPLYFAGYDNGLNYYGKPLLLLATDINNKNTFARYSQEYLDDRIQNNDDEIKAIWKITDFAPYYYNVRILVNGKYTGLGRFCMDRYEMIAFCRYYKVKDLLQERG